MSYDIRLKDPVTDETLDLPVKHVMTGGTYQADYDEQTRTFSPKPISEAWLNVTYNYGRYYYDATDGDPRFAHNEISAYYADGTTGPVKTEYGIRGIYGKTGADSIPMLQDMLEWGDVKNREEYEQYWLEEYPDPVCWYELVIAEAFHKDGSRWFRAVHFGDKPIINAHFDYDDEKTGFTNREEAAIALCSLLTEAVGESMQKLKDGTYNEYVKTHLPYSFRTGVIPRAVLWERKPEWKDSDMEGLPAETISAFRALLNIGINRRDRIGRLKSMTANDFFRACAIGYKACGYNGSELPPVDQYFLHGDGRDEGLSGRGHGLNAGPGIDFDDPAAWDEWYFHREQHGGHPWEVCRGGNSTHVDLYVMHDRRDLDFKYRAGEISEDEYQERIRSSGYFFLIGGKHRAAEAVRLYTALSAAGLPVLLSDAEDIMTRFDGTGYIGIVPHSVPTRYCEELFPEKYGDIIDFMHVYREEMEKFGDAIEWLPEEEARLI